MIRPGYVTVVDRREGLKAIRHTDDACPELAKADPALVLGFKRATATVRMLTLRCPVCFADVERREAERRARRSRRTARAVTPPPAREPPQALRRNGSDAGAPAPLRPARPLSESTRRLLLEVARCPVMEACLEGRAHNHPCSSVVLYQWAGLSEEERLARWRQAHQLPEPWDGHLETAPILFVSSNPSIGGSVRNPQPSEPDRQAPSSFMGFSADEHPSIRRLGQSPRWGWSDEEVVDRYEAAFDVYIADGIRGARLRRRFRRFAPLPSG